MRYDPEKTPNPKQWLSLDEHERLRLVSDAHLKVQFNSGAETVHSTLHVVIENQLASGAPAVVAQALQRLMKEGLTRHDALHAIASVLAEHVYAAVQPDTAGSAGPLSVAYETAVANLTAEAWRDA
jgi:hypothetical protein